MPFLRWGRRPDESGDYRWVGQLGTILSRGLHNDGHVLEIEAILMRTETELILKSRRVLPRRLLENGFRFQYPTWEHAARDLCDTWASDSERLRITPGCERQS
jgi:hypothetical protein